VIHEANGVTAQLLRMCQRFAREGYAAIAPDLFFRSGGTESKPYAELVAALDPVVALADLEEAAQILRDRGAQRVGVTGFCMGGRQTWLAAVGSSAFDAAAGFYGGKIADAGGRPRCPTMLFFGGHDDYIPTEDIERVKAMHPQTIVYPEAGHGFMRDGSESYHEASATDAWERTLTFFGEHLR
jgi:carboxymethylenebutenolidase